MPIVKDPKEVEEIYDWFRERSACLINFCTESFPMTETILKERQIRALQKEGFLGDHFFEAFCFFN